MSTGKDLRDLVSLALDAAGVGTFSASGYSGSEDWPIYWRKVPASPDRCIVVSDYGLGGDYERGIQVRFRGARNSATSAADRADAARVALHGLEHVTQGSTEVALLSLTSTAELGLDSLSRDEVALNFRALTSDPNTAIEH